MNQNPKLNTQQNTVDSSSMFGANPVIRKLGRVTERAKSGEGATYGGITVKTIYFLLMTVVGIAGYYLTKMFYFNNLEQIKTVTDDGLVFYFTAQELIFALVALVITFLTPILAAVIRKTIPVTGTIYCFSQGFLLGWLINRFLAVMQLEHIAVEALGITLILVAVMAVLYTTGIIKVTKKFKTVILVLFITSILTSIIGTAMFFIPATSGIVSEFVSNPAISIGLSVVGIIIATIFLLFDFDMIDKTVQNNLPKKYEWMAAFGLAFTVIWIYLKVLDLLLQLNSKSK